MNLDWLLICIKEYDYEKALNDLQLIISRDTKVVCIRNGLNHYESLDGICEWEQVLECIIDCSVQPNANGYYIQKSPAKLSMPYNTLSRDIPHIFEEGLLEILQVNNFHTLAWKKLIESASLGAVTCLFGQPVSVFKNPDILDLYKSLITESISVAKLDGADVEETFMDGLLNKLNAYPPDKGSSMLTDRILNRKIEINAKNGCISQIGKKHNFKTPYNDLMTRLLKMIK